MRRAIFYLFLTLLSTHALLCASTVVAHDNEYFKFDTNLSEIVFTDKDIEFAQKTFDMQLSLQRVFERVFGWRLDDKLYIVLASQKNQIANAFSTQYPVNMQLHYRAGAQMVDYFSSTSWLDTLLYHESAHNYQINVKQSYVSRFIHAIFGNGSVMTILPYALPNIMTNPFMTEGNAVLNESWHGNGGRLYSGRHKVQTILQAKAGKINPSYVYNKRLGFPYGEISYIQGGFYNLFMAQKYGLESINSYFKNYSRHWYWPFITNGSMKRSVGVGFEESLKDFSDTYAKMADKLTLTSETPIASSQFFYPLNSNKSEIFFLTNESGVRAPELHKVYRQTGEMERERDSFAGGKVFKIDDDYYTQATSFTTPLQIKQGLYDKNRFVKSGTSSKIIQGYLSDQREIYFDVASSFSQPQLFIDGKFYAVVNSSVLIDKDDNLYYFVQNGKDRTLYKNHTPLFKIRGFYSIPCDVDSSGRVYFIASSKLGSTLYRYDGKSITRAHRADNIIDGKLLDDNRMLLASISDKEYYYTLSSLENIEQNPHEVKLFFETQEYYGEIKKDIDTLKLVDTNRSYYSLLNLHYSGTDLYLFSTDETTGGSIKATFTDLFRKNSASLYLSRDESNITVAALSYENSQYLLSYYIYLYATLDKAGNTDRRDSGIIATATLPFLRSGYYYGSLSGIFFQDYETADREPLSATLTLIRSEHYALSMYNNYLNRLTLYGISERSDKIYGGSYTLQHDLPLELYLNLEAKYSSLSNTIASADATINKRGVKLTNSITPEDPSSIYIPNLKSSLYSKSAAYLELGVAKVINLSSYWFTLPLSLQRESVYLKYRHYELESFTDVKDNFYEVKAGATLSLVLMNKLQFPLTLEYIYNSNAQIADENKFIFTIGSRF